MTPDGQDGGKPVVLVAGGGVAALETLLALRALARDRVELVLVAPDVDFVYRPLLVDEPFLAGVGGPVCAGPDRRGAGGRVRAAGGGRRAS